MTDLPPKLAIYEQALGEIHLPGGRVLHVPDATRGSDAACLEAVRDWAIRQGVLDTHAELATFLM
ncbi:MAG: hypothetical protein ABFS30_09600 [Pseudomonadota bacterium]